MILKDYLTDDDCKDTKAVWDNKESFGESIRGIENNNDPIYA